MELLGPQWDIQYPTFRIHGFEPRSRVGADPSLALFILEAVERAIPPQQTPGLHAGLLNGLDDAGASKLMERCEWHGPSNQCGSSTQPTILSTLAVSSMLGSVSAIERYGANSILCGAFRMEHISWRLCVTYESFVVAVADYYLIGFYQLYKRGEWVP